MTCEHVPALCFCQVNRTLILTLSVPACLLTKDWAMRNTGVCIPAPVFLIGLHWRESSSTVIFHA